METFSVTALAMQFLTGAASGAGTSVASEVCTRIRNRLAASEGGTEALDQLEADPNSPDRGQAVREYIDAALREDPAFAEQLRRLIENSNSHMSPQITQINHGKATNGGSLINFLVQGDVHGGTIQVGPISAPATSSTRRGILIALAILIILTGLGIYGSVQLISDKPGGDTATSGKPGGHPAASSSSGGPTVAPNDPERTPDPRLADRENALRVLPALSDLPNNWSEDTGKSLEAPEGKEQLYKASVAFRSPDRGDRLLIGLMPMADESEARKLFDDLKPKFGPTYVDVPRIGDETFAKYNNEGPEKDLCLLYKSGSVLVNICMVGVGEKGEYKADAVDSAQMLFSRESDVRNGASPKAQLLTMETA